MTEILAWLRADIEDELAAAKAAHAGPWMANPEHDEVVAADGVTVAEGFALSNRQLRATVDHIVLHDPRDTIARCEADLAVLAMHEYAHECSGPDDNCMWIHDDETCPTVRMLAYGRRNRPGWRKEWKP